MSSTLLAALSGARVFDATVPTASGDAVPEDAPEPSTAAPPAGQPAGSTDQQVQLALLGGDLGLHTTEARVVLAPVDGSRKAWVGRLPAIHVVDARGVPDGWEVHWMVQSVEVNDTSTEPGGVRVVVAPSEPSVICCGQAGLRSAAPSPARRGGRLLFGAVTGTGGGTFEVEGAVTAQVPRSFDAREVVVRLAFGFR